MSKVKSYFSIKELENISGISAHTIRIWERRYDLFQPFRTSNNTRYYDLNDLQYLLNIVLLRKEGYKISKIASFSKEESFKLAKNKISNAFKKEYALAELKISMYAYDIDLFEKIYKKSILENSFSKVFKDLFLPLLQYLGLFWQTKTITIAHEHFMTNLIYQKIQLNTAKIKQVPPPPSNRTFVLYLPEEEMHEIGILYLNYELRLKGYKTIYLGRSVPIEDLESLKLLYPSICWISNFVITPAPKKLKAYFTEIKTFLTTTNHEYWAIGPNLSSVYEWNMPDNLKIYPSIEEVLNKI